LFTAHLSSTGFPNCLIFFPPKRTMPTVSLIWLCFSHKLDFFVLYFSLDLFPTHAVVLFFSLLLRPSCPKAPSHGESTKHFVALSLFSGFGDLVQFFRCPVPTNSFPDPVLLTKFFFFFFFFFYVSFWRLYEFFWIDGLLDIFVMIQGPSSKIFVHSDQTVEVARYHFDPSCGAPLSLHFHPDPT